MLKLSRASRTIRGAALLALGLAVAAPAAADTIYSWRTDDGSYAFTDDHKSIPAKYRSRAQAHASAPLADYARFTAQDGGTTARYAERLAARLEWLRAQNATPETAPATTAAASTPAPRAIALRTGGTDGLTLDITPEDPAAPVVVETVFTRPSGKLVTRRSQVVRQGDRILAIVRPRLAEWNVNDDIHVE